MCMLYQVNAKLQCKKIKSKKNWIDFCKSGACKIKNVEREITNPKELQELDQAKSAAAILVETLEFWENCVVNKKGGRLVIVKKCKKAKQKIKRRKSLSKSQRRKNREKHRKLRKTTKLEKNMKGEKSSFFKKEDID